jgi:hypothetical protein
MAALLFAVYGCRSGIFFILDPDYLGFELAGTLLVIALALRWRDSPPKSRIGAMVGLGVMAGLMTGLKFPLAATSLFVVVPLLFLHGTGWLRRFREGAVFAFVSLAVFLAVLFTYYLGRSSALPVHFRMLAEFVKHPGVEDRFWASLFEPGSAAANPGADYGYARIVLLVWLSATIVGLVALTIAWRRRLAVILAVSITLSALHIRGLIQRPAGTTLWEISVFLLGASICTMMELPDSAYSRRAFTCMTLFLAIAAAICGAPRMRQSFPLSRLQSVSNAIWESHRELMAAPGPHVFIFLDGSHVAGTVGEVLLKGSQTFPTPQITSGMEALRALGGDLQIFNSTSQVRPGDNVMIVEAPGEHFPELEKGRSTTKWDAEIFPWWHRTIALYRPAGTPERSQGN